MSDVTQPPLLVRDCDESQLLDLIFPLLTTNDYVLLGPGDDCAVIAAPNSQFVVSTDILIENQHFRREWSSAQDVGWRAAMQNLADIAAMGAVPTSVVLALGLPGELPTTWLQDFYRGFTQACQTVGAAVVGGDLSASEIITVCKGNSVSPPGPGTSLHMPAILVGARPGWRPLNLGCALGGRPSQRKTMPMPKDVTLAPLLQRSLPRRRLPCSYAPNRF